MGSSMIDPTQGDLLESVQASVGWALLAARAARSETLDSAPANPSESSTAAPMRFRATITIDIDARDADDAERQCDAVRGQFESLQRAHPSASLIFQRRKPRVGPRAPAPAVVVSPYADD